MLGERADLSNRRPGRLGSVFTVVKLPTFGETTSANTLWSGPSAMIWMSVTLDVARNADVWATAADGMATPGTARQNTKGSTRKVRLNFANALPNPIKLRDNFRQMKA